MSSWYKAGKKTASASPEDSDTAAWLDNAPTAKFPDPEKKETHVGALVKVRVHLTDWMRHAHC